MVKLIFFIVIGVPSPNKPHNDGYFICVSVWLKTRKLYHSEILLYVKESKTDKTVK